VAIEIAVLELDPGAARTFSDEGDLDLARIAEIGLQVPLRADVPGEHQAARRVIDEDPRPAGHPARGVAVIDVATRPRLEHGVAVLALEEVMLARPPRVHPLGEDLEGVLQWGVHEHGHLNGCSCCLDGHVSSSCAVDADCSAAI